MTTMLDKKDVQKRVLQNGNPLALSKFTWCEKTRTFSSKEDNLVLGFAGIDSCTFDTSSGCTFKTGTRCTFDTSSVCTFKTGSGCTFKTGTDCTFKTGSDCTFDTGTRCTFDTEELCTFDTSSDCTFDTGTRCTFKTGSDCTFKTGSGCTFKTGEKCVIVRRDMFEVIQPKESVTIQLCPYKISGYLVNGTKDGKPHIIVDGILSEIISQKGSVYKVRNHGEDFVSYLIKDGEVYSHGETLEEARESLVYKIGDRDRSQYKDCDESSVLTKEECIKMYRVVTGACEYGVKSFVERQDNVKHEYKLSEIVKLTKGQYGHEQFKEFIS